MSDVTDGLQTYFNPAATTERERGGYASEETIDRVLLKLEESKYLDAGQVCYVFGTGDQTRSSYLNLEAHPGIHVVHYESLLPRGLRFIPSYRGLVKIEDPQRLGRVFRGLMEQSTAVALIFSGTLELSVVESSRSVNKHHDYGCGAKADPGYLIYLVDADRDDSPTGMVDFLSYGTAGPWRAIFSDM